jgi:hypothetical protein
MGYRLANRNSVSQLLRARIRTYTQYQQLGDSREVVPEFG